MEIRNLEKKTLALIIGVVIFCSLFSTISVFAAQDNSKKHVPGILLVKFNDDASDEIKNKILTDNAATVIDEIPQIKVKIIKVPENAIDSIQTALQNRKEVQYVETDSIIEPQTIPNDAYFSNEWHLTKIEASNAWNISQGNPNVVIAILDTGFDSTHPDLAGKFVAGYNAYDNSNNWSSAPCGHGTLVAGIAAASTNNGLGIAGLGWQNDILPIKVTGSDCLTTSSVLAKAITYASDHGAKVANISFGVYAGDSTITSAAQYMYNHGGLVVAAGGNSGQYVNSVDNPYIISVSATNQDDTIASFSTFGPYIDFAAPGNVIYTTCNCTMTVTNSTGTYTYPVSYGYVSGTSFSSPIVAGVVALLFSQNPSATPQQVYNALKNSSVDLGTVGYDNYFGWGRIDAYKAMQSLNTNTVLADTTSPTVSITAPINGAYINTTSPTITGSASDPDDYVAGVSVALDGNPQSVSSTTGWSSWSATTTSLAQGSHTISVTAKDSHGNISTPVTSTFIVDTAPPTVLIASPQSGSTVKGGTTISVAASDSSGITKVEIYIDGQLKSTITSAPYSYYWNAKGPTAGSHTITAKAYDIVGNSASVNQIVFVTKK